MKIIKYINIGVFFLAILLIFSACEKKYSDEYNRYNPTPVSESNVNIDYSSPLEAYPTKNTIVSDTPTFNIESYYFFGIDTVYSTTGGSFKKGNFSIDPESGTIAYKNSDNSIGVGKYSVDVSVLNLTGMTVLKSAFELRILEIPVNVTASPDVFTLNLDELGVFTQLSVTADTSVTIIGYNIDPYGEGFSIDEDTNISMDEGVEAGEHKLAVIVKTNLGDKLIKDVLTVTVQ